MKHLVILLGITVIGLSCKSRQQKAYEFKYYSNGKLMSKFTIINGVRQDTAYDYYLNGDIYAIKIWKNNKLNGRVVTFYPNHKKEAEGYYQDSLRSGEWFFYDSIGNKTSMENYFVFKHKSYSNNRFVQYKDSAQYAFKCFDYDVVSKMDTIINTDTLYDFDIDIKCHILNKVRIIYGLKEIPMEISDYKGTDTLYSNDGHYIIQRINCRKIPNLLADVECYTDTIQPNGKPGWLTYESYFLLSPNATKP